MADLVLIPISGEVMEHNLARSLGEPHSNPWAFNAWKRQMQAVQPGSAVVFVDMCDQDRRQVNRFTKRAATLSCRRAALGQLTSGIEKAADPFFVGYPFEFSFELTVDHGFDPPAPLDDLAAWLNHAVDGLDVEPVQLRELVANAKSNKIGVFVDGAPRRAGYFPESAAPGGVAEHQPVDDDVPRPSAEVVGDRAGQISLDDSFDAFSSAVRDAGLVFLGANEDLPRALLAAIVTKPFAILSGLSGSGKTQLACAFGRWLGRTDDGDDRYTVVPVRPDWTSPEPLLGYEDALLPMRAGRRAWTVPAPLRFMLTAARDPDHVHLLVLDEMNLAHVERYFADVLSGIESGEAILPDLVVDDDGHWRPLTPGQRLAFPPNLAIIGTVNVDETTYQFSPKVLDRAFSFDFRVTSDELAAPVARTSHRTAASTEHLDVVRRAMVDPTWAASASETPDTEVRSQLIDLHRSLAEIGFEFGHRTFQEALGFSFVLERAGVTDPDEIVDWIIMAKVLPRLHGSRRQLEGFLSDLLATATGSDGDKPAMPLTARKLRRMVDLIRANQFVSFAE
jgi:5-methylcytosine-specific restriction protein B